MWGPQPRRYSHLEDPAARAQGIGMPKSFTMFLGIAFGNILEVGSGAVKQAAEKLISRDGTARSGSKPLLKAGQLSQR